MVEFVESDCFIEGNAAAESYVQPPTINNFITRTLKSPDQLFDPVILSQLNKGLPTVCLVGFACEGGARACPGGRCGPEKGPEAFREIMNLIKVTDEPADYVNSKKEIQIIDCGDVEVGCVAFDKVQYKADDELFQSTTHSTKKLTGPEGVKQANERLTQVIKQIHSKVEHSVVFIIGGTDDMTFSVLNAMEGDFSAAVLDPCLDVKTPDSIYAQTV